MLRSEGGEQGASGGGYDSMSAQESFAFRGWDGLACRRCWNLVYTPKRGSTTADPSAPFLCVEADPSAPFLCIEVPAASLRGTTSLPIYLKAHVPSLKFTLPPPHLTSPCPLSPAVLTATAKDATTTPHNHHPNPQLPPASLQHNTKT